MLNGFDTFNSYTYSVVRTTKDFNNVDTLISGAAAYSYTWTVTVSSFRAPSLTSQNTAFTFGLSNLSNTVNTSTTATPLYSSLQNHSPPISGTFQLTINNTQVVFWDNTLNGFSADLPYNIVPWNLQSFIQ
jgi:hypothetical protein